MSRGISWRQRVMLQSIARRSWRNNGVAGQRIEPVAWRDIDYGPTQAEGYADYDTPRWQWNKEQVVRRALRSLERRGLVELGSYVFHVEPIIDGWGFTEIRFTYTDPDRHIPGSTRIMTGALLTDAGWAAIHAERPRDVPGRVWRDEPAEVN